MHSEPSKAAMERAQSMSGHMNASVSFIPVAAVASYIDTVDHVAREAGAVLFEMGASPEQMDGIRNLMLPDEPDAKAVLAKALRDLDGGDKGADPEWNYSFDADEVFTALAAAGYTITKEPTI